MGKGLGFLSLKFYHPSNRENQQRKWEALQRESQQQKHARERQLEQQKEKELLEMRLKIVQSQSQQRKDKDKNTGCASSTSSGVNITSSTSNNANMEVSHYEKELHKAKVAFLYTEPPGLKKQIEKERKKIEEEKRLKDWQEASEHMSKEERRLAEKEMEEGLPVHERNARRFEFLKNAPMVDDYVKNIEGVVHKPFGKTIKHVRCFKCWKWGHPVGDRECEYSTDFTNKFAIPEKPTKKYVEEPTYDIPEEPIKKELIKDYTGGSNKNISIITEEQQPPSEQTMEDSHSHLLLTQDEMDKIEKEDPLVLMKKSSAYHHRFDPFAGDEIADNASTSMHETMTVFTLHKNDGNLEDGEGTGNSFAIKNTEERKFDRNDLILSESDDENDKNRPIKKSMLRKLLSGKERYASEDEEDNNNNKQKKQKKDKKVNGIESKNKKRTEESDDSNDEDLRFINSLDEKQKKALLKQIEKDLKRKKEKNKKNQKKREKTYKDKHSTDHNYNYNTKDKERDKKRKSEKEREREKERYSRVRDMSRSRSRGRRRNQRSKS